MGRAARCCVVQRALGTQRGQRGAHRYRCLLKGGGTGSQERLAQESNVCSTLKCWLLVQARLTDLAVAMPRCCLCDLWLRCLAV